MRQPAVQGYVFLSLNPPENDMGLTFRHPILLGIMGHRPEYRPKPSMSVQFLAALYVDIALDVPPRALILDDF